MKNGKICILIADDEKEIRDILRLLLTGEGYAVCTAENGREALALASAEVDLYLLDVNMPELSGFMAGAEIRKQFDTPIIFLTAYSGESDKVMGFSVGADDYIVKPFSNMELEMSRNVQSGNTQNLKSTVIQRSFPKWSVAERRKTAAASDQAAVCACAHSRYFTGGSPSGLRV